MFRTRVLMLAASGIAACDLVSDPNQGPEYMGPVAGAIADTVVSPTGELCVQTVAVSGIAWVGLVREGVAEGDGGVNLQFGSAPCGFASGTAGDWTAALAGQGSALEFNIHRGGTTPGDPNAFTDDWNLRFAGTSTNARVTGTLVITRTTSQRREGGVVTSRGSGRMAVTMVRCDDAGSCGR